MKLQRVAVGVATAAAGITLMAGVAVADDPYVGGEVKGITETQPAPAVSPAVQTNSTGPVLALTGADVAEITVVGIGLVSLGTVMVRRSRKAEQKA